MSSKANFKTGKKKKKIPNPQILQVTKDKEHTLQKS